MAHPLGVTRERPPTDVVTARVRERIENDGAADFSLRLERAADENDRRKLVVTLTRRGRAAAEVQARAREQVDAELLARVGARAVSTTRRTLAALIDLGHPAESGHRHD